MDVPLFYKERLGEIFLIWVAFTTFDLLFQKGDVSSIQKISTPHKLNLLKFRSKIKIIL